MFLGGWGSCIISANNELREKRNLNKTQMPKAYATKRLRYFGTFSTMCSYFVILSPVVMLSHYIHYIRLSTKRTFTCSPEKVQFFPFLKKVHGCTWPSAHSPKIPPTLAQSIGPSITIVTLTNDIFNDQHFVVIVKTIKLTMNRYITRKGYKNVAQKFS